MDRPRQLPKTRWQRSLLLRSAAYALLGTAIAMAVAFPLVNCLTRRLTEVSLLSVSHKDIRWMLLQGSTFVFAYLWLAYYMLERTSQHKPGLTSTNGS